MKKYLVAAAVLCIAFAASAKKMTVLNVDKGQITNENFNCEVSLTEDNAPKKGGMMMKIDVKDTKGEGAWVEATSGGKVREGFDVFKCYMFNPTQKPIKLRWDYQPGGFVPYAKRFVMDLQLKPGKNDVEIELLGAVAVDGTQIDWKTKAGCWGFCLAQDNKPSTLYMGNQTVETTDDDKGKK